MDLLRFATAGSVDDGKSTLIGRLLYDTKTIFEDQLEAVERTSRQRGRRLHESGAADRWPARRARAGHHDRRRLSLLRHAEAQVHHRGHAGPHSVHAEHGHRRVDGGPGHRPGGRAEGHARAEPAPRLHRHRCCGVPHLVCAVNKMDLVDYAQSVYDEIRSEFAAFASKLSVPDLTVIPIAALHGDNVVSRSERMPWYGGPTLLHHLENVHIASDRNMTDVRFPVQYVIRPQSSEYHDYRGYAGSVAGGVLKPGDDVVVLPSGFQSRIASIETEDGPVDEAFPPMAVTVRLEDDLDVSRGDLICRPHNVATASQELDAMVCWMSDGPLVVGRKLAVKHTTRSARAMVKELRYRLDVNTLHRDESADQLSLNDIGRIRLRTTAPLFVDDYRRNRATGGFILIDEATNDTVGAGMVVGAD